MTEAVFLLVKRVELDSHVIPSEVQDELYLPIFFSLGSNVTISLNLHEMGSLTMDLVHDPSLLCRPHAFLAKLHKLVPSFHTEITKLSLKVFQLLLDLFLIHGIHPLQSSTNLTLQHQELNSLVTHTCFNEADPLTADPGLVVLQVPEKTEGIH